MSLPARATCPDKKKRVRTRTASRLSLVEGDGFEPSKALPTDLQSAPFGHSGIPPYSNLRAKKCGADDGTRTRNLLITNQLLYQLSYIGKSAKYIISWHHFFVNLFTLNSFSFFYSLLYRLFICRFNKVF